MRPAAGPEPYGISLTRARRDGAVVLMVGGELDFGHAPQLGVAAAEELRMGNDLIIDLGAVTFLDSTGVAMLLNACRRATRSALGFAVVCPDGPALQTIAIARLTETLKVCGDQPTAVGRMRRLPGSAGRLAS